MSSAFYWFSNAWLVVGRAINNFNNDNNNNNNNNNTRSITHSFNRSSLVYSLARSLVRSFTRLLARSLCHHSLAPSHSLAHSLARSIVHSLAHSLVHLLAHSLYRLETRGMSAQAAQLNCSVWDSNPWPLKRESNALTITNKRHTVIWNTPWRWKRVDNRMGFVELQLNLTHVEHVLCHRCIVLPQVTNIPRSAVYVRRQQLCYSAKKCVLTSISK